ncbi:MAG: hypothetical protein J5930_09670 [Treponema sp.]|nr:hypothetical protein [Treponema sp.]
MSEKKLSAFFVCPLKERDSPERNRSEYVKNEILERSVGDFFEIKHADEISGKTIIHDTIIDNLKNADLVIADLTGLNSNVFYELGVRDYTGKPTLLIAEDGTNLPFDVRAMSVVFYPNSNNFSALNECRSKIRNDAKALMQKYNSDGFCENIAFKSIDSKKIVSKESLACIGQRTSEKVRSSLLSALKDASEIDIYAMTGETSTEVISSFKEKLLGTKKTVIRILALDKESSLVSARFSYIREGKLDHFFNRSDYVRSKYEELHKQIINDENKKNTHKNESYLAMKRYDDIPYFSYIRCDNKIFLAIYTATKVTRDSFTFYFERENNLNFALALEEQFNAIWNSEKTVPIVIIDSGTIVL